MKWRGEQPYLELNYKEDLPLKKITLVKEKKNPILLVKMETWQLFLNNPWSFSLFSLKLCKFRNFVKIDFQIKLSRVYFQICLKFILYVSVLKFWNPIVYFKIKLSEFYLLHVPKLNFLKVYFLHILKLNFNRSSHWLEFSLYLMHYPKYVINIFWEVYILCTIQNM